VAPRAAAVIAIQVEDGGVAERLAAMGGAVRAALAAATQALADQLVAAAQARLPSGPLADSIAAELDARLRAVRIPTDVLLSWAELS